MSGIEMELLLHPVPFPRWGRRCLHILAGIYILGFSFGYGVITCRCEGNKLRMREVSSKLLLLIATWDLSELNPAVLDDR